MTRDLVSDLATLDRIRTDEGFAQAVYAALCNMQWRHADDSPDEQLSACTWRGAGGLVASIRGNNDTWAYTEWYCSGIDRAGIAAGTVTPEGTVRPDVAEALAAMGWTPVPYPEDEEDA